MAAFLSTSNENDPFEKDNISKCGSKDTNLQNSDDESAKEERPTKIIDLNDDCLMKIFG